MSQLSATEGFRLKCSSLRTRESKINSPISWDWASLATRGSRLGGLFSMITTMVLGSGRLPQDRQSRIGTTTKNQNPPRRHGGTEKVGSRRGMQCAGLRIRNLAQHSGIARAGG